MNKKKVNKPVVDIFKDHPIPNKIGSYAIKVGGHATARFLEGFLEGSLTASAS